ncbi:MAG TPA: hypothetical protein VHQ64_20800 [Pyrinomonadaceae bacterium]|nr:hypothetical protein [Pyrinomonadaceae bacterium]
MAVGLVLPGRDGLPTEERMSSSDSYAASSLETEKDFICMV